MKIKTKKQLNLPQLIEWGFENDVTGAMFSDDRVEAKRIRFEVGILVSIHGDMNKEDTFTVEVEEEITEDTKLDLLLDHFINPYGQHYVGNIHHNRSINDILEENDELKIATNFIHILDKETKEFKLIWRDGKLVE